MEYTIKGPDPGNLVWGGVVAMTADELALEFLQQELKWGRRNAHWKTLRSAAEEKGLAWITIRRAAKTLGVKKGR